jgi:LacI family transcriptional regulator
LARRKSSDRIKITDVAQSLGIAPSTVSRALNGYADINPATRLKVEEEVRRVGYFAHSAGRKLRGGRANAVGFVLPPSSYEFADPVFLPFLAGIDAHLRASNLQLLVTTAPSAEEELRRIRHMLESHQVDAMILVRVRPDDPRIAYLAERQAPFSMLGQAGRAARAASVEVDHDEAVRLAVGRLVGLGIRQIAHINVPGAFVYGRARQAAFVKSLNQHGIEARPDWQLEGDLSERGGHAATQALLAHPERVGGIICGNDSMAFGAMHALVQAKLAPGRDVAVIGCDDVPMAALANPPLTTLNIAYREIGARVADNLLRLMAGEDPKELRQRPKPHLVVRQT